MNAVLEWVAPEMVLIDLVPGSKEWLAWREKGIGASEAATIMGENPFQTQYQLWAEKTGLVPPADLSNNPHVQRGVRYEEAARESFEATHRDFAIPLLAEHPEYRFIRASFDGISVDGYPLEIKCPSGRRLEAARAKHDGVKEGTYVPLTYGDMLEMEIGYYYGQVQQQMLVAQAGFGILYIYDVENEVGYGFIVRADLDYQDRLVEACGVFWQHVLDGTEPPHDPEKDVFKAESLLDGADPFSLEEDHPWLAWQRAEVAWSALDAQIKGLEAQLKELKDAQAGSVKEMVGLMGNFLRAEGLNGMQVTRFSRKGSIDYKAALDHYKPNVAEDALEAFRRKGADGVRITLPKSK